jgi:hypothetical protein
VKNENWKRKANEDKKNNIQNVETDPGYVSSIHISEVSVSRPNYQCITKFLILLENELFHS